MRRAPAYTQRTFSTALSTVLSSSALIHYVVHFHFLVRSKADSTPVRKMPKPLYSTVHIGQFATTPRSYSILEPAPRSKARSRGTRVPMGAGCRQQGAQGGDRAEDCCAPTQARRVSVSPGDGVVLVTRLPMPPHGVCSSGATVLTVRLLLSLDSSRLGAKPSFVVDSNKICTALLGNYSWSAVPSCQGPGFRGWHISSATIGSDLGGEDDIIVRGVESVDDLLLTQEALTTTLQAATSTTFELRPGG